MTAEAIRCHVCGEDSFLKRVPQYDGFRKIGEVWKCAACGHAHDGNSRLTFLTPRAAAVFDTDTIAPPPRVFQAGEAGRCCRHCGHYVVNPFTQRCALHARTVEATDVCDRFSRRAGVGGD